MVSCMCLLRCSGFWDDFVCFDVCVYSSYSIENAGVRMATIYCVSCVSCFFVKEFAKHITFACIGFVWFYLHSTNISRIDLVQRPPPPPLMPSLYLDDLDEVGGETLLLLLILWLLLLLLLVRLPQIAVIAAMLIAFVVVVVVIIGVVAVVTIAKLAAATARTVLPPTLATMPLLLLLWLLLAPAALFNKLLLKNS